MTVPERRVSRKNFCAVSRPFSQLAIIRRFVSTPPALLNTPSRDGATVTSGLLSLNPIGRGLGSTCGGGRGEGGRQKGRRLSLETEEYRGRARAVLGGRKKRGVVFVKAGWGWEGECGGRGRKGVGPLISSEQKMSSLKLADKGENTPAYITSIPSLPCSGEGILFHRAISSNPSVQRP